MNSWSMDSKMVYNGFIVYLQILVLSMTISYSFGVTVSCIAGNSPSKLCLVDIDDPYVDITRTTEENSKFTCKKGVNYGYVFYGRYQAYLFATTGCGGTFVVTARGGAWTVWGPWSACSVTCHTGLQTRTRSCSTGRDQDCTGGSKTNKIPCLRGPCPSSWGQWGAWGGCSVSCGGGMRTRSRGCSGGKVTDCVGAEGSAMAQYCYRQSCSVRNDGWPNEAFCGKQPPKLIYKIIGGYQSGNCEYPWMVLLYNRLKGTICGGTIIDRSHILTAAHCVTTGSRVFDPSDFLVWSGSSKMPIRTSYYNIPGIRYRTLSKITIHHAYNSTILLENDIALLKLSKPITYDNCHAPICLPNNQKIYDGCKVMGWGNTANSKYNRASPNLRDAAISVYNDSICKTAYRQYYSTNTNICAGGNGTGSCAGDSGGPLLCPSGDGRYYQFGIVSGGQKAKCGVTQGLYTKVSGFKDWILTSMT